MEYTGNPLRLKEEIKSERRWNMKCLAIFTYHTLMCATRENKRTYKWRVEDTASDLQLSIGFISESIKLAKALGTDDKLKFMSRDEALKKLRNGHE